MFSGYTIGRGCWHLTDAVSVVFWVAASRSFLTTRLPWLFVRSAFCKRFLWNIAKMCSVTEFSMVLWRLRLPGARSPLMLVAVLMVLGMVVAAMSSKMTSPVCCIMIFAALQLLSSVLVE